MKDRERRCAGLLERAELLAADGDPQSIGERLRELAGDRPSGLSEDTAALLLEASHLWTGGSEPHPSTYLVVWWKGPAGTLCSKRVFGRLRYSWPDIGSRARTGEQTGGGAARDHQVLWEALAECPVMAEPRTTTEAVLSALAAHCGIPADSPEWLTAAEPLRAHLLERLSAARQEAPGWVRTASPALRIGECLPKDGSPEARSHHEALRVVEAIAARAPQTVPQVDGKPAHLRHRDLVVHALRTDAERVAVPAGDRAELSTWVGQELGLARLRLHAALEADLPDPAGRPAGTDRLEADVKTAERLGRDLLRYEEALERITYPHIRDPWLVRLPLERGSGRTMGFVGDLAPDRRDGIGAARSTIGRFDEAAREALSASRTSATDGTRMPPEERFAAVFAQVVPAEWAATVLAPFEGADQGARLLQAIRERRLVDVLAGLDPAELHALTERVGLDGGSGPSTGQTAPATPETVQALFGLPVPLRVRITHPYPDTDDPRTVRVRTLADLLCRRGIDARLDTAPDRGPAQRRPDDFVLVVDPPDRKRPRFGLVRRAARADTRTLTVLLSSTEPAARRAAGFTTGSDTPLTCRIITLDPEGVEPLVRHLTAQ
ncbi:hypothetical protein ACFQ2M_31680 [Kitasatospora saccharophila]|uniref:hypothetical protein n=1 Tax=Kitasatospora saccharophila TaxID=407973 RepID=UPI00362945EC